MQRNYFVIIVLIILSMPNALAGTDKFRKNDKCGDFQIVGAVKSTQEGKIIQVYSGSRSEINLIFENPDLALAYDDKKVIIVGRIEKRIHYGKGHIIIKSIKEVVPNFMKPFRGDFVKLISSKKCH